VTRVALLDHTGGPYATELSAWLREAGVEALVLGPRPGGDAVERLLARRGFAAGVGHVPAAIVALRRGGFDLAHALTPPDAVAALAYRRVTGRPVVFTCTETPERATLADRRLQLGMLEQATQRADAVLAASDEVAAGMWRWLALEAQVSDAEGYAHLYGELLAQRG
jgi:hypothetical protein